MDRSPVPFAPDSREERSRSVRGLRGWVLGVFLAGVFGVVGCVARRPAEAPTEWRAWQERRKESIAGTNGWMTLAGLHWLREGDQGIGSDPTNAVVLPAGKAPASVGIVTRVGSKVRFRAAPGAGVIADGMPVTERDLMSDLDGAPTRLQVGDVVFWVLDRGERMGIRVREPGSAVRRGFSGLDYFPYAPEWRVAGRFEPYADPGVLGVSDSAGGRQELRAVGDVVFGWKGTEYRLQAVEEKGESDLFVIFRDRTAGDTTYASGRFLYVPRPEEGD
ncbi:MAG: DUF1684 domain-containing protein, partial [Verrucomicrobiales bacterium]|nr:DUF1684 domain-containing protein [Verrucomicrobiales bacterium]